MATCLAEITADLQSGAINEYPIVTTNVGVPVTFSPTVKQKLYLATNQQESIVCNLTVQVASLCSITFFRLSDNRTTITNVGGVTTSESITNFQKDLTPGEYFICFAASFSEVVGTFKATFSGFIVETRLPAKGYAGEYAVGDLKTYKVEKFCNEPMTFELISGELPPGCVLQPDGRIIGYLPNLDCLEDHAEYSPSINWFYEDHDSKWRPIPRRWVFRAKVTLVNFPHVTHEQNFAIEVHNDWSKDRDAFMLDADKGFDRYRTIQAIELKAQVDTHQFECPPPEPTPPKQIAPVEECCSCGSVDINRDLAFVEWYLKDYAVSPTPEIAAFVENFKSTQKYKQIAEIYGKDTALTTELINTAIQISTPSDGKRSVNDIDYLFLEIGKRLNMNLPTEAFGYTGEELKVTMK